MITIYNYAFTMLGDCVVTLFELLTHILNTIIIRSVFSLNSYLFYKKVIRC